jgi:para-nitrobenzyl esterase
MSHAKSSARAKLALSALAAACVVAAASSAVAAVAEPVQLDAGRLGGSVESAPGIREFRGIPFAAPPVGELRWREPQDVPKWDGVRSAAEFGNVCIQPDGGARGNIGLLPEGIGMSEDCLYLNVWTGAANANERRPVMMYIYGGNYSEGAGSAPLYNGTELAKKGAVVVTMNYRMGSFGFFAHPALTADSPNDTSGNYGIMDMFAALEWIQANIEQFGGDPSNASRRLSEKRRKTSRNRCIGSRNLRCKILLNHCP